ncbi:Cof-type HAD-IIB family hydrolase [Streptococcus zalophi]|uniref:Cof-type HAD-IIB family hydrolase n=1 Tax=Streptococcus zalophi TaxID=640031 RepID=UPI00215BABFD|nr:Cof-type HAD-IIB family hydrolase [Streptococcus zalophi]MCR8967722.1 Cof-type HAD-IIB family hydrolase [Streptococcus zalophi]
MKIIATDMDGTFLRNDKTYDTSRFQKIFEELQKKQIHFVIASGNQYLKLREYFEEIAEKLIYISENGAQVWVGNTPIASYSIPHDKVKQIVDSLLSHPKMSGDKVLLSGKKGAYILHTAEQSYKEKMKKFYKNIKFVDNFDCVNDEILKITMNFENNDLKEVETFLNEYTDVRATTSGFYSIDVVRSGISKATGIDLLCTYFHISAEEIVAFGDNLNDLEMLKAVGKAYATKNAVEDIKKIALEVIPSSDEQGVLFKIEKLLGE